MTDHDIDDTAQGMKLTPTTAMVVSASMLSRPDNEPKPYATCPHDDEPLICTLEHAGAEFLCMVCGRWYGWLAPTPQQPTPELDARYEELRARFDRGERP